MPTTPEVIELIQNTTLEIIQHMGIKAHVDSEDLILKGLVFNITPESDPYLLIGHRGASLHALEHVVQAIVARKTQGAYVRFTLDVDDYKRKREWYIKETVRGALDHIARTGRAVALMPMPNFERKLVHALVGDMRPDAVSVSSGEEPYRRVIIRIKN